MRVVLLTHTDNAELIAHIATRCCQSGKSLEDIMAETSRNALDGAVDAGHTSVLEHISYTFWIEGISRACSHQLVRYRHASFSQQSQRHIDPTKEADWYVVPPSMEGNIDYHYHMGECAAMYKSLVESGVPLEDARGVLPNYCKTRLVMTLNERELQHIANERLCVTAQWEIRDLVQWMVRLANVAVPRFTHKRVAGCWKCRKRRECAG